MKFNWAFYEIIIVTIGVFILLLFSIFSQSSILQIIITVLIFIFFCVFGGLLIRNGLREIEHKKTLEIQVQERTRELQIAKNIAEQRAHELENAKNLAEAKNEELIKQKDALEKFYKLTIGRELKMIDLKNQVQQLEAKVKNKK